jgi:hypothetical protein
MMASSMERRLMVNHLLNFQVLHSLFVSAEGSTVSSLETFFSGNALRQQWHSLQPAAGKIDRHNLLYQGILTGNKLI